MVNNITHNCSLHRKTIVLKVRAQKILLYKIPEMIGIDEAKMQYMIQKIYNK